jgi:hypothetical protein
MLSELRMAVGRCLETLQGSNGFLGRFPRDAMKEACLMKMWGEERGFPGGDRVLSLVSICFFLARGKVNGGESHEP